MEGSHCHPKGTQLLGRLRPVRENEKIYASEVVPGVVYNGNVRVQKTPYYLADDMYPAVLSE